jgi:hypothetical protein
VEPASAVLRPTGMERALRVGTAASGLLMAGLLVGCGTTEGRTASDSGPSDSSAPSATAALEDAPGARPGPHPGLVRCLHAGTVPADGETLSSLPDPTPHIDGPFWFPFNDECPPTFELQDEPGTQPLS